jgi:hypothetical protein
MHDLRIGDRLGVMSRRQSIALAGLFVSTFSLLALSGPGRIDIIDGQTRYEVARSLVEHGDVQIRDPTVWYPVAPGRDGRIYTNYRLPHSLLGVPAILLADATGPVSEARRHFFFSLINAFAGAACVLAYAIWFLHSDLTLRSASIWAALGLLATPLWYYSASTFDDALGAAFVLWALLAARLSRERGSLGWGAIAGMAIGIAINCKQPLGIFLLPVAVIACAGPRRNARLALIAIGAALGGLTYLLYERYKFPPGTVWLPNKYAPPVWHTQVLAAALVLLVSPAAGILWYCPAIVLACAGYGPWRNADRRFTMAVLVSCVGFFVFICCLGFFKGDVGWGPRYLTPVIAVLWLMAPAGAARLGRSRSALLIVVSVLVQLLSLGHDPHRLYVRNQYQPIINIAYPWLHFDVHCSHLLYRPIEIIETLASDAKPERFSPAPSPTYAMPPPDGLISEPEALTHYRLFQALRPWWACQFYLPADERPVNLIFTLSAMVSLFGFGLVLMGIGLRPSAEATP